jgi:hypothetical protein
MIWIAQGIVAVLPTFRIAQFTMATRQLVRQQAGVRGLILIAQEVILLVVLVVHTIHALEAMIAIPVLVLTTLEIVLDITEQHALEHLAAQGLLTQLIAEMRLDAAGRVFLI